MNQISKIDTCAGPVLISWAKPLTITGLELPEPGKEIGLWHGTPDWLSDLEKAVQDYFLGGEVDFHSVCNYFSPSNTKPCIAGCQMTSFQRKVYEFVSNLSYGEVMTYGDVARGIGRPKSARAVGRAMGANPVPLIVPCHRVVGRAGIGGFSAGGGANLKRKMLELEGVSGI